MIKLVYVSTLLPDGFQDSKSSTMIQYSADNMSTIFLEGLIDADCIKELDVLNIEPISSWPLCSQHVKIKDGDFIRLGQRISNVQYLNVGLFNQVSKYRQLVRCVRDKVEGKDTTNLIVYSMSTPLLLFLRYAKKRWRMKTCMIVTDLPVFPVRNGGVVYRLLKRTDIYIQRRLYKYVDFFALFSDAMKEWIGISKDYIVLEGAVSTRKFIELQSTVVCTERKERQTILYSGQIEFQNGIKELIETIEQMEELVDLVLIGSGQAVQFVREKSKRNTNIKYLGTMTNTNTILEQKKADILINPRPNLPFAKYSFPSKTLEYMLSGVPIIMQKLDGIPEEYDCFLNYCTFASMGQVITEVLCNYDKYKIKAKRGQEFVIKNKNAVTQVEKLIRCLDEI